MIAVKAKIWFLDEGSLHKYGIILRRLTEDSSLESEAPCFKNGCVNGHAIKKHSKPVAVMQAHSTGGRLFCKVLCAT